ncbi:hypothetical protein CI109_107127 [Kwoniella shandongensis]|uniref:Uncharacterized protein n=1 Tax=Kwoniella shandongensis TaxID=1734106 RepID=A0A5M6C788_9TREE|nr:uncharacterized protein CI109_002410 [Kwoniella shandongensis]KAA5529069.1 hypothetical protein CI109_002410 [Kwoniella shandongensis]
MPLYKITEKRLKKREWEDETGITALKSKMREMGEGSASGSGEEWSDESDSESGSDDEGAGSVSDDDDDDEGSEEEGDEEDEDVDGELDSDAEDFDEGSSDDDGDEEGSVGGKRKRSVSVSDASDISDDFSRTVEETLEDPIYTSGEIQRCVFCPGKLLKNDGMLKDHLESKAHKRASKRFSTHITAHPPPPGSDPREIVEQILDELEEGPIPSAPSASTKETRVTQEGAKKEGKSMSRKERKEHKARLLLEQNNITGAGQEASKSGDGEGGLNRKARRLLAAQQKGEGKSDSAVKGQEGKSVKDAKDKSTKVKKQKVT